MGKMVPIQSEPEEFVSHNGNPENGDYGEYARFLERQERLRERSDMPKKNS